MQLFTIEPTHWYATLAVGDFGSSAPADGEFHSPLRVNHFSPLKSGNGNFEMECFHPLASGGHHTQVYRLQTLNRGQHGLMARHIEGSDRLVYFTSIDFRWMQKHFPNVVSDDTPVQEWLDRSYNDDAGALVRLLINKNTEPARSVEKVQHWSSDRYWTDAFALLEGLKRKRLISLDLDAIQNSVSSGESIAYKLMNAMFSVKELEGWGGYRGAPRLLLLALARLEEFSQLHSTERDTETLS